MGLIRDAVRIDKVIQRQHGLFAIVHAEIHLRQLLFVPVVPPFRIQKAFTVTGYARHITGNEFLRFPLLDPVIEESAPALAVDPGKEAAQSACGQGVPTVVHLPLKRAHSSAALFRSCKREAFSEYTRSIR